MNCFGAVGFKMGVVTLRQRPRTYLVKSSVRIKQSYHLQRNKGIESSFHMSRRRCNHYTAGGLFSGPLVSPKLSNPGNLAFVPYVSFKELVLTNTLFSMDFQGMAVMGILKYLLFWNRFLTHS